MSRSRGSSVTARTLTRADARRLLVRWHFEPTDVAGVFDRFGSIQYDPLRPMGTNVDLVLQARVPGYRTDAWHEPVYGARLAFDGWDKQASLVRTDDWPQRRIFHRWHHQWWRERVFERHAHVADAVLGELERRGPLASSDFEDPRRTSALEGSWYGASLTKHALRALWHTGRVATHHRRNGQHAYDLVERVIPAAILAEPEPSAHEQIRFLVAVRHRAVGLLRPNAGREVWSLQISSAERHAVIGNLAEEGVLVAFDVEGTRYHAHRDAVAAFERSGSARSRVDAEPQVRFLAPLDPFVWDRAALAELFEFEYVWEVYKPQKARRWGYYVLPVLYGDRLVGRFDGRLDGDMFELHRFWPEPGFALDAPFVEALERAFGRFLDFLGAARVRPNPSRHAVARPVREALYRAERNRPADAEPAQTAAVTS